MLNDSPHIYLCASSQDRPFVEMLCQRLRPRGLTIDDGGELGGSMSSAERQRMMDASQLILVVVSRASGHSAAVADDYRYALAHNQRVIPLIGASVKDLPADLSHVQAVNFAVDQQVGWAALLIVLDTLGLARFPVPTLADIDAEVVLARARSGRTPPTWYVSRLPVPGRRRLTRWTIYGSILTILLTILAFFATGRNPLIALPAVYILYQIYIKYSPEALRLQKNGMMVILTPDGFVVTTRTGGAVSAAFRDVTTSAPLAQAQLRDVHLKVDPRNGRPFVDMTLSKFPGEGVLGQQAFALYKAYLLRYQAGGQTPMPSSATAPLVFISYSRRDASIVDRFELSLQSAGYNPWVDRSYLLGGQAWSAHVREAIDQCAAMVVVISPDALRSAEVAKEYQYALQAGKPVFGAMVRTTYRIPSELRQHAISDHRENLLLGLFDLAVALDGSDIRPLATFGALPGSHIPRSATLMMAQALHGGAVTDGATYRASLPARFPISIVILLLALALGCLFSLVSGSVYPLFLGCVLAFGVGLPNILFMLRRLRYPDTIIALPEGYITFLNSARLSEHPYGAMSAVTLAPPSLFRGPTLVNIGVGTGKQYSVPIRPGFHKSRQIAEQIVANFNTYQQHAIAGAGMSDAASLANMLDVDTLS